MIEEEWRKKQMMVLDRLVELWLVIDVCQTTKGSMLNGKRYMILFLNYQISTRDGL